MATVAELARILGVEVAAAQALLDAERGEVIASRSDEVTPKRAKYATRGVDEWGSNPQECRILGRPFVKAYDSKKEFLRYQGLRMLEVAGLVQDLARQVRFELLVPTPPGTLVCIGSYFADFTYEELDDDGTWHYVVEDVKSEPTRTPLYQRSKRHVEAQYGLRIRET